MTARTYLPWVRSGTAGAITAPDPLGGSVPARATFPVAVGVNAAPGISVPILLYGPGEVLGFDARQVLRREPAPGSSGAEPNYFPLVEFARPDLPWQFTPAKNNAGRLRPWIVLVVVERAAATLETTGRTLPVLHVDDASQELPDLSESWAWVHAQVRTVGDLSVGGAGGSALSRLVCPRRLKRRTAYLAAVVPTFDLGRRAGLGLPVGASTTSGPAWGNTSAPVDLPVYLWWEFVTGAEGDFEALVSRLSRVSLGGATAAGRPFMVADLPAGLPALGEWRLPGALGECPDPLPDTPFGTALRTLLNTAPGVGVGDLPMPPPIYGRWHAARPSLQPGAPGWLERLNLDPRYRAVAALGTRIVQEHQEDLIAAAWRQAGPIEAANRLLRQGQLARGAGAVLHADLAALPAVALLQVTAPVHPRALWRDTTVAATVAASRVPVGMVGQAFRRALRPRGPVARRARSSAGALLTGVNDRSLILLRPPGRPDGVVTADEAVGPPRSRLCHLTRGQLAGIRDQRRGNASAAQWVAFIDAAVAHQQAMPGCERPPQRLQPALDLGALQTALLRATDPTVTVPARLLARVTVPTGWQPADPLEPVMVAPRFDDPVYRDLAALGEELLVPGIGDIPANAVTALPTNARFVEALLVGLNAEMGRELLWRGFPTDQRGTCFRRFWDHAGSVAGPVDDIGPIDEWTGDLGAHLDGGEQLVLLVRGEVLHRYPRTMVYAAQARWDGTTRMPVSPATGADPKDAAFPERYPVFSGSLPPDITFLGFALDPEVARGKPDAAQGEPGWFLVFQQPPSEPRLGLDADLPDPPTGESSDLSWPAVATTASGHVSLAGGLSGISVPGWGVASTSAALASLTEQRPFRICIHASDLLPPAVPA